MANWSTIASFATAIGTLVLAGATFSAIRSSNRSARIAEEGLLANIRPLLVPSLPTDTAQKVLWSDFYAVTLDGGRAVAAYENDVIYVALGIRNVGAGIALLHGWRPYSTRVMPDVPLENPDGFRTLTIDLYVAPRDSGYFEGAIRDADDPIRHDLIATIKARQPFTVDLLYGDQQGRQRSVSRFTCLPGENEGWFGRAVQHRNLDAPNPR
jgi:hypothetical protein